MKKIFTFIVLSTSLLLVSAQSVDRYHNIQINLGGGLGTMLYEATDAQTSVGMGGIFGLQYQVMFNHNIGVGIGANVFNLGNSATYNGKTTLAGLTHPDNNQQYDHITTFNDWQEKQSAIVLGVPLQLMLRAPLNEQWAFQMGLGGEFCLPLNARYGHDHGSYKTTGYFPSTNITYEDLPNHGFTTVKSIDDATFSMLNYFSALLDLGFVTNLSDHAGLYLGLYGSYGLNNVIEPQADKPLVDPLEGYNGTFNSDRVGEVHPFIAGIKIGIRFSAGKNVDWKQIKAAEEAAAAAAEAARLEKERIEAEARAKADAEAKAAAAKAEAEARAKAQADSIARVHAEELARQKAAAEAELAKAKADADAAKAAAEAELARAKAEAEAQAQALADAERKAREEAEARARAEAEARARAKAEQKAREEAAFLAGYKDVAYFETGKDMPIWSELNEDSWDNLKDVMDRYPDVMVTVTGHTDNVGQPAKNMKLSQSRADNIKAMLVMKGISPSRITSIGKGDTDPIESNKTKEGRAKNRRIEITIYRNK